MEPFQGGTDAKSALADVRAAHPTLARDGARDPGRALEGSRRLGGSVPASIIPFMFAKEGLARHNGQSYLLDPIYFSGSPLEITAMANGQLEIGTLGYSTFSIAVLNAGLDGPQDCRRRDRRRSRRLLLADFCRAQGSRRSKNVDGLRNKVVATNAIGAGAYSPLEVMLRQNGLLPKRDYRVVETQFSNMKPMLLDSKVDLITATLPFVYDPELQTRMRAVPYSVRVMPWA